MPDGAGGQRFNCWLYPGAACGIGKTAWIFQIYLYIESF